MIEQKLKIQLPSYANVLFQPARIKVLYGGRGSAKSWSAASALIIKAAARKHRILCARELQNSIDESVHKLLSDRIDSMGYKNQFDVQKRTILGPHESNFIFEGLKNNINTIKSLEGVDICWVEEAETVSRRSWEILLPTIRKEGSEIWITFNPESEEAPTLIDFVKNARPGSIVQLVNHEDNPFFPEVLRAEMEYCKSVDVEAWEHIWRGKTRKRSKAQIFADKYEIGSFEVVKGDPAKGQEASDYYINGKIADGPYYGGDWGFNPDPLAGVKLWICDFRLYVEYESYGVGVELDGIVPKFKEDLPGVEHHMLWADNSRPDTIAHVNKHGLSCAGAEKGDGSVEEGIAFLKNFKKIVVHQRCKNTLDEMRLYSLKQDRLTLEVMPEIVDKFNHIIDAIRYALWKLIKQSGEGMGLFHVLQAQYEEQERERLQQSQGKSES